MAQAFKKLTTSILAATLLTATGAQAFELTFDWGDLVLCTTGSPNTVTNPTFSLKDVPPGTKFIRFKLTDLDAPGYRHGGGTVAWSDTGIIQPGAFSYKSPCPPNGSHTYEWRATAQSSKSGGALGTAKASTDYP